MERVKKTIAVIAGALQSFVAIGALPCGLLLMLYPDGSALKMSLSQLARSPFAGFFWPGLILFSVNGLGQAAAAVLSFRGHRRLGLAGAVMGLGLMIWIFVQASLIGGGHWLQYLYFGLGAAEVSLAVLWLSLAGERPE
jgi:hypothetical protein